MSPLPTGRQAFGVIDTSIKFPINISALQAYNTNNCKYPCWYESYGFFQPLIRIIDIIYYKKIINTTYDPPDRGINTDKLFDFGTNNDRFDHFVEYEFCYMAKFISLSREIQEGVVE